MNFKYLKKMVFVIFFIPIIIQMFINNCHATILGPNEVELRGWLYNQKIVVGKKYKFFKHTETINIYNVSNIRIIDYEEKYFLMPLTKNIGVVRAEFTYSSGGVEQRYNATITYTWEYGVSGKKRYPVDVIIENK